MLSRPRFLQLVDSFETGLLNQILFEVEYNRRAKNDDDLGVRIQNLRFSDPTASKAIEHIMIREAVEECNFSGNILKETDNPEKHKRDILTIHMMRREYEVFDSCLKTLPGREYRITYDYIHKDRKLNYSHVEYVINCLGKNTTKVRNIKSYLLASLFNAGSTISSYYRVEVNHDMPQFAG